jgi:hypothetical protein
MTILQNLESTRTLVKFKRKAEVYFGNVDQGAFGLDTTESPTAKKMRSQLNVGLDKVKRTLSSVDVFPSISQARRLAAGESEEDVDLVENIFNLHRYQVSPQILVDHIERAIGIYRDDRINAWMRTLNPLFWLSILFDYAGRLPFFILGSLGFDRSKLEGGALGKFLKGCFRAALLLVLLTGILHYLGALDPLKSRLRALSSYLKLHGGGAIHQLEQRTDEFILDLQGYSPENTPESPDPVEQSPR